LSACIAAGGVFLSIYAVKWGLFIHDYVAVDPNPSVPIAAWLFIKTRIFVPAKLANDGFLLRALIELYWELGMPILQLIIITFGMVRSRKPS
jgi:hypothetical protein